VLAFGWILTLLPVKSEVPSAGLVGGTSPPVLCPVGQHRGLRLLGAYFFAINLILRRCARGDLGPTAYSTIMVRVIVAVLLGWLVKVAAPDWPQAALLVAAFLIGIVSETFLPFLREVYRAKWVGRLTGDVEEPVLLKNLEGIDLYDCARLLDERIANVEALANHDLICAGLGVEDLMLVLHNRSTQLSQRLRRPSGLDECEAWAEHRPALRLELEYVLLFQAQVCCQEPVGPGKRDRNSAGALRTQLGTCRAAVRRHREHVPLGRRGRCPELGPTRRDGAGSCFRPVVRV
jgi:hypothetical protein